MIERYRSALLALVIACFVASRVNCSDLTSRSLLQGKFWHYIISYTIEMSFIMKYFLCRLKNTNIHPLLDYFFLAAIPTAEDPVYQIVAVVSDASCSIASNQAYCWGNVPNSE